MGGGILKKCLIPNKNHSMECFKSIIFIESCGYLPAKNFSKLNLRHRINKSPLGAKIVYNILCFVWCIHHYVLCIMYTVLYIVYFVYNISARVFCIQYTVFCIQKILKKYFFIPDRANSLNFSLAPNKNHSIESFKSIIFIEGYG